MPPVFGRYRDEDDSSHPYDESLKEWSRLSLDLREQARNRARVGNIRCDYRVSEPREEAFNHFVASPCSAPNLRRAFEQYFTERIRVLEDPDFVDSHINSNNVISRVDKDLKLARVLDLNGLRRCLQSAFSSRGRGYGKTSLGFPRVPLLDDHSFADWLDNKLISASQSQKTEFISVILSALNEKRRTNPFQPTWATSWTAFAPFSSGNAGRWVEVLGVYKLEPRWQIVLQYTVAEAGVLVRPTQLDAGTYEFHFPSPPHVPLEIGGHPMDLQISPPARYPLMPEYIHRQIDHSIHHWTAAGSLIGRTDTPPIADLIDMRQGHYHRLIREYGPGISHWLTNPL